MCRLVFLVFDVEPGQPNCRAAQVCCRRQPDKSFEETDNDGVNLRQPRQFVLDNFYHHKSLLATGGQVRQWLEKLFGHLCKKPGLMPGYFQRFIKQQGLQRAVCDYIAGMTDRYALDEYKKLFDPYEKV